MRESKLIAVSESERVCALMKQLALAALANQQVAC